MNYEQFVRQEPDALQNGAATESSTTSGVESTIFPWPPDTARRARRK